MISVEIGSNCNPIRERLNPDLFSWSLSDYKMHICCKAITWYLTLGLSG